MRGYADAANWVYGHGIRPGDWQDGDLISLAEVREVHSLAMTPLRVRSDIPNGHSPRGTWLVSRARHRAVSGWNEAPEWTEVPVLVRDWLVDAKALRGADETDIAESLAALHARFEQIHPFLDGNGRAGRLLLNLLLIRLVYPPAIIYKGDRTRYLAALRRADDGDLGPLGEFLARAVLDNLYKFVVPAIAGPARLVPLPALATKELSANALRVAPCAADSRP